MQSVRHTEPTQDVLNVAVYGNGAIGKRVTSLLARDDAINVQGPFTRDDRSVALTSGADVVVIATASFLTDIIPDVRQAIESGSNVITTAEEAAYPLASQANVARDIDQLARTHNVTVLGAGLNPGLAFDALVLTLCGAMEVVDSIRISRTVDLSGWGATCLATVGCRMGT